MSNLMKYEMLYRAIRTIEEVHKTQLKGLSLFNSSVQATFLFIVLNDCTNDLKCMKKHQLFTNMKVLYSLENQIKA